MEPEVIEEEVSLFDDDKPKHPLQDQVDAAAPKDNSPSNEDKPEFDVPDKFKGKSFEDVVQSYMNLEKMHGNTANEVGELRKLTDQILMNQAQMGSQNASRLEEHINDDVGDIDFFDDPSEAVNRAVGSNPTIKRMEAALARQTLESNRKVLLDAHPDADEIAASATFQAWLSERPGRAEMFRQAHTQQNVDIAIDLLDTYKATKRVANEEATLERDARAKEDLKKAEIESGGSPSTTKKVFKRSELIQLKISDPRRYEQMKDEIMLAYAEGRVK